MITKKKKEKEKMPPTGLEPATLGLKVRCSSRLSYEGNLSFN